MMYYDLPVFPRPYYIMCEFLSRISGNSMDNDQVERRQLLWFYEYNMIQIGYLEISRRIISNHLSKSHMYAG